MKDTAKTKKQLIAELAELRDRCARLDTPAPVAPGGAPAPHGDICPDPEHRLLHGLMQSLDFPLYVIDVSSYEVVLANAAMCLSGAPWGMTCHALTHHSNVPCSGVDGPCPLDAVRRTKQPAIVEHRHYEADGSIRYFEVHAFPLMDGDGNVTEMVEYNIDVTDRRRTADELRTHRRSLELLVRQLELSNEELRAFASLAAHDIRSPMASISSAASLLEEQLKEHLNDDVRTALDILLRGVERTSETIASLYRCCQVSTADLRFSDIDLNRIVQEITNFQLLADIEQSGGQIHVPQPLHAVRGDEMQILGLMQNLVANGLKYHREGVAPEVTILSRDLGNGRIRLEIKDNGIGIRDADQDRAFGMFTRLDDAHASEGLGIGLAFCKRVAERHGGRIGVQSTYGSGSTFWVELPAPPH